MSKALVVVSNVGRIRPDVALAIAVDLLEQSREEEDPFMQQAREWSEQCDCNRRDRELNPGMARTYDRSGWLHRIW